MREYTFTQKLKDWPFILARRIKAKTDLEAMRIWCADPGVQELSHEEALQLVIESKSIES